MVKKWQMFSSKHYRLCFHLAMLIDLITPVGMPCALSSPYMLELVVGRGYWVLKLQLSATGRANVRVLQWQRLAVHIVYVLHFYYWENTVVSLLHPWVLLDFGPHGHLPGYKLHQCYSKLLHWPIECSVWMLNYLGVGTCLGHSIIDKITDVSFFARTLEALVHVRKQLQLLWSSPLIDYLFSPVLALTPATIELPSSKGIWVLLNFAIIQFSTFSVFR